MERRGKERGLRHGWTLGGWTPLVPLSSIVLLSYRGAGQLLLPPKKNGFAHPLCCKEDFA